MKNNTLEGYSFLIAACRESSLAWHPEHRLLGLARFLGERGAHVTTMETPLCDLSPEQMVRACTAWRLYPLASVAGTTDYSAVICLDLPTVHISHPKKVAWLDGWSANLFGELVLSSPEKNSSLLEEEKLLLHRLCKVAVDECSHVFVTAAEDCDTFEATFKRCAEPMEIPPLPGNINETAYMVDDRFHLIVVSDEKSIQRGVQMAQTALDVIPAIGVTFIGSAIPNSSERSSLARAYPHSEITGYRFFLPQTRGKVFKNPGAIVDLRQDITVSERQWVFREALIWGSPLFIVGADESLTPDDFIAHHQKNHTPNISDHDSPLAAIHKVLQRIEMPFQCLYPHTDTTAWEKKWDTTLQRLLKKVIDDAQWDYSLV